LKAEGMSTESRTTFNELALGVIFVSTAFLVFAVATVLLQKPDREVLRIVGPSMWPGLLGQHAELLCHDCGNSYTVDAERVPVPDIVSCPHCRRVSLSDSAVKLFAGERVTLDHVALLRRGVQRFDVVAFEVPGGEQLAVKRVIGLPGERVAIRQGDIYINEEILTKPAGPPLNVLVHDATIGADAWRAPISESAWQRGDASQAWLFEAQKSATTSEYDWLEFHPPGLQFVRSDGGGLEDIPSTLGDNDAYNLAQPRELNSVFDSDLTVAWSLSDDAVVSIRAHDGWQAWHLILEAGLHDSGQRNGLRATLSSEDGEFQTILLPDRQPLTHVRFAIIDHEVRVTLNDRQVLQASAPQMETRIASSTPWAIGILRGKIEIHSLRIERDVYYLDPAGLARPWELEQKLAGNEYFLLGDNPAVSTDSRHFGPVPRKDLRGIVHKLPVE
jgi:type IV secretory pathway protease TraF